VAPANNAIAATGVKFGQWGTILKAAAIAMAVITKIVLLESPRFSIIDWFYLWAKL
jgi:hypothetical protein